MLFGRSLLFAALLVSLACADTPPPETCEADNKYLYLMIGAIIYSSIMLFLCIAFMVVYRAHLRYITRKMTGLERAKKHKGDKKKSNNP